MRVFGVCKRMGPQTERQRPPGAVEPAAKGAVLGKRGRILQRNTGVKAATC